MIGLAARGRLGGVRSLGSPVPVLAVVAAVAAVGGLGLVTARPAVAQRDVGWELRVADRLEVAAGGSAALTVALAVDRGVTVSRDADVILDLEADPGLAIKKRRLGRRDAVDPDADAPRFAITVRADAPGPPPGDAPGVRQVRLRLRFWLCRTRTCRPIDVRRAVTIAVSDASTDNGNGNPPAPGDSPR